MKLIEEKVISSGPLLEEFEPQSPSAYTAPHTILRRVAVPGTQIMQPTNSIKMSSFWQATSFSVSQEISCHLRNCKVHYCVHKSTSLDHIMNQINLIPPPNLCSEQCDLAVRYHLHILIHVFLSTVCIFHPAGVLHHPSTSFSLIFLRIFGKCKLCSS